MADQPWYKRARRWCQTNLTENDGRDYDLAFWRSFWKKNDIQGTVVNTGGTVGYFPSENPYQYRAKFLNNRDLVKEIVDAAREDGLAIIARMDINQASEALFQAEPGWFMRDIDGNPVKAGVRYITCINGPYYQTQVPKVMREILGRYQPDGFTDNSWTGSNALVCYCENCKRAFREAHDLDLPEKPDYEDRAYRLWLKWATGRRTEIWNYFNEVVMELGGEDCLWMGMLHPEFYPPRPHRWLYDDAQLDKYGKAHIVDHQAREEGNGFEQNAINGMMLHNVFGQDTLLMECTASYNKCKYFIRKSAAPAEEMRTWMISGISAGLSPSPHFIGSTQEDRRIFNNCAPVMAWHRENEKHLYNRELVTNVGLVWSRENLMFYGQSDAIVRCYLPFYGFARALLRKRISYCPVNVRHIPREAEKLDVLVLPDLATLSDEHLGFVVDFIKMGKSVVVTGGTGMLDELGFPRKSFPLDDVLGIRRLTTEPYTPVLSMSLSFKALTQYDLHNYMRLPAVEKRHEIVSGFDETDIIILHGQYYDVRSDKLKTVATLVPPFPIYPPEFAYMDDDKKTSDTPVILAGETGYGGRAVYIAGDMDRRYGDAKIPDQADVLANAVRWASGGKTPFTITGHGRLDCRLYKQADAYVFHCVNLSGLNEEPTPVEEHYPVGPNAVSIRVGDRKISRVTGKVDSGPIAFEQKGGWVHFTLDRIDVHEMLVLE